mgnify:CR=1 FL=1
MPSHICNECCHLKSETFCICRCTENKIIGCMYIELMEGCIFYDIELKKRCKNKVIETENGKMHLCIDHGSKKKIDIKTTESKKKMSEVTKETNSKKKTNTYVKKEKKKKINK